MADVTLMRGICISAWKKRILIFVYSIAAESFYTSKGNVTLELLLKSCLWKQFGWMQNKEIKLFKMTSSIKSHDVTFYQTKIQKIFSSGNLFAKLLRWTGHICLMVETIWISSKKESKIWFRIQTTKYPIILKKWIPYL
jgi:hypothetical protein